MARFDINLDKEGSDFTIRGSDGVFIEVREYNGDETILDIQAIDDDGLAIHVDRPEPTFEYYQFTDLEGWIVKE